VRYRCDRAINEGFQTMRILTALLAGLTLLGGCAYRDHDRMGADRGDYYDGYYDGSYGAFHDGYWGNDGSFYYADSARNWHRDEGKHFRRDTGDGSTWARVHGSGVQREH